MELQERLFWSDTEQRVWDVKNSLEDRRGKFLHNVLKKDASCDIYGEAASIQLLHGVRTDLALAQIERSANWFRIPHPNGRDHKGECDFTARRLLRLLNTAESLLPSELLETVKRFYTDNDFESMYESENHRLIYHTSKYLFAAKYPDCVFQWSNVKCSDVIASEAAWLMDFLRYRSKRGWGEFDSCGYMVEVFSCLYDLHDFAPDQQLRKLCAMTMDILLLDIACDSLNGLYGGAHGRIYSPSALDHFNDGTALLYHLYFSLPYGEQLIKTGKYPTPGALLSTYRPSNCVYEVAVGRNGMCYANRESSHLHSIPFDLSVMNGNISKYTYLTPNYVIGAVNWQDEYPADHAAKWYAHHQQHEWDLTFACDKTNARIFTHHPGDFDEHNHWTGDLRCGCVQTFCNQNVVLATYDIANGQSISRDSAKKQIQQLVAHLPLDTFDEVVEHGNWVFVRCGQAYGGLFLSEGYHRAEGETHDIELLSDGSFHGCICEASISGEDFADFIRRLCQNDVKFDPITMRLTYRTGNQKLILEHSKRQINGENQAFPYDTFDSPYVKSKINSAVVTVKGLRGDVLYDFEAISVD